MTESTMALQVAGAVIGILITMLLAMIAWSVNRICAKVDQIDRDLKAEARRIWTKLDEHEVRVAVIEVKHD